MGNRWRTMVISHQELDMLIHLRNGKFTFRPIVEVNPRYTMGQMSIEAQRICRIPMLFYGFRTKMSKYLSASFSNRFGWIGKWHSKLTNGRDRMPYSRGDAAVMV